MTWVRLDDRFHRNPKQLRLSDAAFRLWVCSWSYCAEERQPTGYMTFEQGRSLARSLGKPQKVIKELLIHNAWESTHDGYLIHDFEKYSDQGSAARTRKWRSERQKRDEAQASQEGHGDSHRDVTVTRAHASRRAPVPVPDPVPVVGDEVTSTSEPTNPPATPPIQRAEGVNTQNGELPQVLRWMQLWSDRCGGRALTEPEREFLRRVPYECDRLSEQQVTETLAAIAEKHLEAGKRVPLVTYAAGKLSDLQAQAAENGAKPQPPRRVGPVRISEAFKHMRGFQA